ncbi:hypothetical protein HOLleu_35035 [Holothuria leucospilota]|uniref:Uncharacterized protein n=1 Tax=Holothuria leucospilota TaxID=206669 RepID=A0A9Q0YM32_HOLLE|nr:hypothetical protein HOLleu_35035 [Holothuria leucospilota]
MIQADIYNLFHSHYSEGTRYCPSCENYSQLLNIVMYCQQGSHTVLETIQRLLKDANLFS